MSAYSREDAAERILWSLGMRGTPAQVKLLLFLVTRRDAFTAPELVQSCGVTRGRVYPFLASLKRRDVVFALPRPEEPREWGEVYGRVVLRRKRRELHVTGPAPLAINVGRLRTLAAGGCSDGEALKVLEEAVD